MVMVGVIIGLWVVGVEVDDIVVIIKMLLEFLWLWVEMVGFG